MALKGKKIDLIEKMPNSPGEIILGEIIQQAFKIFANKLGNGGVTVGNEFTFQFELGNILNALGKLYEFKFEDRFQLDFLKEILIDKY